MRKVRSTKRTTQKLASADFMRVKCRWMYFCTIRPVRQYITRLSRVEKSVEKRMIAR